MKLFFASDLHGSFHYCKMLKNIYEKENADRLILLGDLLYHGPRNPFPEQYSPKDVIPILNEFSQKIICVRGNCDSEVDQMVLDFPILSDYNIINIDGIDMFLTHGHIYNRDKIPKMSNNGVLICGHTHINAIEKLNNTTYINTGSISMPKKNQPNSYMIYENKKFTIKDLYGKELKFIKL